MPDGGIIGPCRRPSGSHFNRFGPAASFWSSYDLRTYSHLPRCVADFWIESDTSCASASWLECKRGSRGQATLAGRIWLIR